MTKEELIIELPTKMVVLKSTEYENEIDVDSALKIDYANIMGEILTFPVFLNRIGVLLAEADNQLRDSTFNIDILKKELKNELLQAKKRARAQLKRRGISSPTLEEIEVQASEDVEYQASEEEYNSEYLKYLKINKGRDQINVLYWSAKSKDEKLNKLSEKIRSEEFEKDILEGNVNGILIKCTKKLLS